MLRALVIAIIMFSVSVVHSSCPWEYSSIDPNHSFCSRMYPDAVEKPVTDNEREYILRAHNNERQLVRASNMEKMYWNEDLATIALHYARGCDFKHDTNNRRSVPKIPLSTGQNLAMGYENWTQAVEGWIEEKQLYYYGYPSTGVVGHYTQMIWHSTVLVGCGAAICPPYGPYMDPWPHYVCNYITGQLNTNIHSPYRQADEDRRLHDCSGKVCLYNGTLDLNTCQCQCSSYASGDQCEYLNCEKLPPCYYPASACVAVNVPLECPRLCGLCDRYEVLKQVYRENNLAPQQPIRSRLLLPVPTSSSTDAIPTTAPLPSKRLSIFRKAKKVPRLHRTTTTTTATTSTTEVLEIESLQFESSASTMRFQSVLFAFFWWFYCIV